jgi:hypothetical protein
MTESRHSFQGKPIGAGRAQSATDVGVVVVTYRSARTIRHCLALLLASDAVVRIVVVDNASDDGTLPLLEQIARANERVTLVRNNENRGFAAACNQGASALATPWVAFINPDCYVEPGAMLRLVAHGIRRAGAGMIGADLVGEEGRPDLASRRRDPSLRELLGQRGRRDDLYLGEDPNADLQPVEAISGALMLMPLGLFLQLGGFDESYRLHVEDLDLCRRTREAGYEVLVANDITVLHVGGVSSRSRPAWVEWQKHRSLWRYFRKFEAAETPTLLKPVLWLGLWAHFVVAAARAKLQPR